MKNRGNSTVYKVNSEDSTSLSARYFAGQISPEDYSAKILKRTDFDHQRLVIVKRVNEITQLVFKKGLINE